MLNRWAPPAVVLALLVATATAFVVTERLKLERNPVQRTQVTPTFSPGCDCDTAEAHLSFRLRRAEETAVDVVASGGTVVRTLLVSQRLAPGEHRFTWNGRDDAGTVVPDGVYRIRFHLARGRTITVPNRITIDTAPPRVASAGPARPAVFSPDGDGRSDGVKVAYELSEPAQAVLYVNGRLRVRTHAKTTTGRLAWYGRAGGRTFRPGRYELTLGARDLAGNLGIAVPAGTVRLRFVELPRRLVRVGVGRPFTVRVSTDAGRVAWKLGNRRGVGGRVLRLRAPAAPGRYRLVVTVGRHQAAAFVLVTRPR